MVPVTSSGGVNLWVSNNPASWDSGRMTSKELRANPILIETDSIRLAEEAEGRALKADLLKINLERDDARLDEFRLLRLRHVALENLRRAMGVEEAVEPILDATLPQLDRRTG